MNRFFAIAAVCIFALGCFAATSMAQREAMYTYSVKFICGKEEGKILSPGVYMTAINVHNPNDAGALYQKKFSVALPGEEAGPVSEFFKGKLGPAEAMEIDCADIRRHVQSKQPFIKGFVLIRSTVKLNIVAVYTVAGTDGQVQSIDVEHVPPLGTGTGTGSCPDLVVTAIADPEWDGVNHQSIIRATIKNIGDAPAEKSYARVIDPSTPQPTGAPYNDVVETPALAPGKEATVEFHLPYWVYNPDATLEVTADYKGMVKECREDNNMMKFDEIG